MKKLALRFCLFIGCYLLLVQAVRFFYPPAYHWGNAYFSQKTKDYAARKKTADILFIGSSRLYRQVNPVLFDSLVNASGKTGPVQSFNYGTPATFAPEAYRLCEHLLQAGKTPRVIFIELNTVPEFTDNLYSVRGGYWLDAQELQFSLAEVWSSESHRHKAGETGFLLAAFLQNSLTIRYLDHREEEAAFASGPLGNGYYSLDSQLVQHYSEKAFREHFAFTEKPELLDQRREAVTDCIRNARPEKSFGQHLARLQELDRRCKAKGIRLFYVIPPRLNDNRVLALAGCLPQQQVLNYADPQQYPELYLKAYTFDVGHLNDAGAAVFSRLLAEDFLQRIK